MLVYAVEVAHVNPHLLQDGLKGVTIDKHQLYIVQSVQQKRNPVCFYKPACLSHLVVLCSLEFLCSRGHHEGLAQQLAVLVFGVISEKCDYFRPKPSHFVKGGFLEVVINGEDDAGIDKVVEVW